MLRAMIASAWTPDRHRHRHPALAGGEGEGEAAVGVALIADAAGGGLVPDLLALTLAEQQAQVLQPAQVAAELLGVDAGALAEQPDVGAAGPWRPHLR